MKKVFRLFLIFFKIGLFTFGGGYAMIALIENEFVSKRGWLDKDEFLDMVAIAESTPGPVAINSSTYIGYKLAGVAGATASTVAVCIPSVAIIYAISLFFDRFMSLTLVSRAFNGIRVCVVFLIISAGVRMLRGLERRPINIIILIATSSLMLLFSVLAVSFSSVIYILTAGIAGYSAHIVSKAGKGGGKK